VLACRFGIAGLPSSLEALRHEVRRYEAFAFDFVGAGDHVGGAAPFSRLSAAAVVSERLRLRTYVLNVSFWNPVLLAREAATLDCLSGGRLELGLGAGTVRSEFEAAEIIWQPARERVERMEQTIIHVRETLADSEQSPQPAQTPIPILVGAMSRGGLAVAAEHADIVGFSGLRHASGHPPGTLRAVTAEETDALVALTREQANGRTFESDVLLQAVELGRDPLAAAKAYIERDDWPEDPHVLAESPCVLFARTAAKAAIEIQRRRERWGFTSFTTFAASADALAAVRDATR
jgi:probable F420-dependent oxidoreductase